MCCIGVLVSQQLRTPQLCAQHSYANTDLALPAFLAHLYANILVNAGTVIAALLYCVFIKMLLNAYCYYCHFLLQQWSDIVLQLFVCSPNGWGWLWLCVWLWCSIYNCTFRWIYKTLSHASQMQLATCHMHLLSALSPKSVEMWSDLWLLVKCWKIDMQIFGIYMKKFTVMQDVLLFWCFGVYSLVNSCKLALVYGIACWKGISLHDTLLHSEWLYKMYMAIICRSKIILQKNFQRLLWKWNEKKNTIL